MKQAYTISRGTEEFVGWVLGMLRHGRHRGVWGTRIA